MNPINRIGQRVICVGPERIWLFVCPTITVFPRTGAEYTVAGFADHEGLPSIHLREIGGMDCKCAHVSGAPWLLSAFRPVNSRETDISTFTEILNDAPATPEPVA